MTFKISGVTKGGGIDFASKEVDNVHYPIIQMGDENTAVKTPAVYNVTDLASAKTVLIAMAKMIIALRNRVFSDVVLEK